MICVELDQILKKINGWNGAETKLLTLMPASLGSTEAIKYMQVESKTLSYGAMVLMWIDRIIHRKLSHFPQENTHIFFSGQKQNSAASSQVPGLHPCPKLSTRVRSTLLVDAVFISSGVSISVSDTSVEGSCHAVIHSARCSYTLFFSASNTPSSFHPSIACSPCLFSGS